MNASKFLAIAAIAAVSFGAQADEADASQYGVQFNGTKTRAEVQAQLAAKGVNTYSISYNPVTSFQGKLSRAQVTADYLASRDQVAAVTGEDSGSAFLAASAARRTRSALAGE